MEYYKWSERYSLKNERIDMQHKKFFELINNFISIHNSKNPKSELEASINELKDYTIYHFNDEIKFYEEIGVSDDKIEEHLVKHNDFIKEFNSHLEMDYESESASYTNLIYKVTLWLINHILLEDLEMMKLD